MSLKLNKILFITWLVFCFFSTLVKNTSSDNDDEAQNELIANLFQQMGLDKSETITRENLRTLLDSVLGQLSNEIYPQQKGFFKSFINKYTAEVPKIFPKKDISKYLSQERILAILQEAVKENYGEKYSEDLKPVFDNYMESNYEHVYNNSEINKSDNFNKQSNNLNEGENVVDQIPNESEIDL